MNEDLLVLLVISISIFLLTIGFMKLFDFISDSDIWVRREDRDQ